MGANSMKAVEGDLADAQAQADKILGANTGIGELSKVLAEIKAKAVHEQYSLGLAKAAVDKLIPTAATFGPDVAMWTTCTPVSPTCKPGMWATSRKYDRHNNHFAIIVAAAFL